MKMTKLVAIAAIAAALGVGAATAQIKQSQPAEFPSGSYKGKQYVDSKGCVFIRAGIDGNVSWVPRVTRDRKVVCGFKPTDGAQSASAAPARPVTKPPVQITLDQPVAAPVSKPAPRVAAPKPRVAKPRVAQVVRQTAPQPQRRVVRNTAVAAAPRPAPAPVQQVRTVASGQVVTSCRGASALSQRYLRGDGKSAVRCGPQDGAIVGGNYAVTSGAQASAAPVSNITDHTRIVPKHVAIRRANTTNVHVPAGYRKVWEDGRLNPKRAEQSLSGRGHMLLIWTNTVPRRLINQADGKDVTASVPLVYPYLDLDTQSRDLGAVTIVRRGGKVVKRIVRHSHAKPATRAPVYSTRSAPAVEAVPRAAVKVTPSVGTKRYVHIGLFSTKAKAQRAAQHLAGIGMRARLGNVRHKGKSYLSVQAGPFNGAAATQTAVSRLRGIGYTGAKARK